jgi:Lrp/AsnC family transcriptional regulator, leucine-responsive regulatory protein
MDDIDRKILWELQRDARISNVELAERVGLSASPCLRRVRQLEEGGIIRNYRAVLDHSALDCGFEIFISFVMQRDDRANLVYFEEQVAQLPHVKEAHRLFGDPDYLLRVAMKDVGAYERFYSEVLCDLPGVMRVTSHVIMKEVRSYEGISTAGA